MFVSDVFKFDAEFQVNEEKYASLRKELLDEDSGDSDSEDGSGEDGSGSDSDSDNSTKSKYKKKMYCTYLLKLTKE
jgi:pre-mRNA-splicing factor CWC22